MIMGNHYLKWTWCSKQFRNAGGTYDQSNFIFGDWQRAKAKGHYIVPSNLPQETCVELSSLIIHPSGLGRLTIFGDKISYRGGTRQQRQGWPHCHHYIG